MSPIIISMYIKDLARAPEIVPSIFYFFQFFYFFDFFLIFSIFFARTVYITIQCDRVYIYIYLGAGKHPSPLDISESYSPDRYLKVGFYLIKKYCSCPKLLQF